jgi:hypothetical protein
MTRDNQSKRLIRIREESTMNIISNLSVLNSTMALTAAILVFAQPASATDCKRIITDLNGTQFVCAESPIGYCSDGAITSGILKGTKLAVYQGMAPFAGMPGVEPESVFSYSGPATFSTGEGELWLDQVGVLDLGRGLFTELQRVVGGTGRFSGASGHLFVSGQFFTETDWTSDITGFVCLAD